MAPQIDYTQHILLPFLQRHFSLAPTIEILKRGYFPKGGGVISVSIPSTQGPLPAVTLLQRGPITRVRGYAYVAGLPTSLAQRMRSAACVYLLSSGLGITENIISIESVHEKPSDVCGSGSGIVLWVETGEGCILGGSALGAKEKEPEIVGREAAEELVNNLRHGGCVDEYLQVNPGFVMLTEH